MTLGSSAGGVGTGVTLVLGSNAGGVGTGVTLVLGSNADGVGTGVTLVLGSSAGGIGADVTLVLDSSAGSVGAGVTLALDSSGCSVDETSVLGFSNCTDATGLSLLTRVDVSLEDSEETTDSRLLVALIALLPETLGPTCSSSLAGKYPT